MIRQTSQILKNNRKMDELLMSKMIEELDNLSKVKKTSLKQNKECRSFKRVKFDPLIYKKDESRITQVNSSLSSIENEDAVFNVIQNGFYTNNQYSKTTELNDISNIFDSLIEAGKIFRESQSKVGERI